MLVTLLDKAILQGLATKANLFVSRDILIRHDSKYLQSDLLGTSSNKSKLEHTEGLPHLSSADFQAGLDITLRIEANQRYCINQILADNMGIHTDDHYIPPLSPYLLRLQEYDKARSQAKK